MKSHNFLTNTLKLGLYFKIKHLKRKTEQEKKPEPRTFSRSNCDIVVNNERNTKSISC